jgi:hypothetical protein
LEPVVHRLFRDDECRAQNLLTALALVLLGSGNIILKVFLGATKAKHMDVIVLRHSAEWRNVV